MFGNRKLENSIDCLQESILDLCEQIGDLSCAIRELNKNLEKPVVEQKPVKIQLNETEEVTFEKAPQVDVKKSKFDNTQTSA